MHCLYFICKRKFYLRTHVKITRPWKSTLRELISNNDKNNKTAIGLEWQNNNFISALHFCKFLCCHSTTMTWNYNCPILHVEEDMNTIQKFSNFSLKLRYRSLECNPRKIHQHLMNWATWESINSLCKGCLHHHHGPHCWSYLFSLDPIPGTASNC